MYCARGGDGDGEGCDVVHSPPPPSQHPPSRHHRRRHHPRHHPPPYVVLLKSPDSGDAIHSWKAVDLKLTEATNEAKDNLKYLLTLERYLKPLRSRDPKQMIEAMPGLFNAIKVPLRNTALHCPTLTLPYPALHYTTVRCLLRYSTLPCSSLLCPTS